MSTNYFIGDLHIGHRNIYKFRGFESNQVHDDFIMDNIKRTVSKRDILWLLGDCFFNPESINFLRELLDNVTDNIKFVLGNHDTDKNQKVINELIDQRLMQEVHGVYKKRFFWLTHVPMHPDELRGKVCIHGHTHNHIIDDDRYLNVCCEQVNYTPISQDEVLHIFRQRDIIDENNKLK